MLKEEKTIKLSDYVAKRLVHYGVKDVFMISGGGAMHLNDSIGKCKDLKYYCNHHEQASAIAAEGYARVTGKLAVVVVTSGPGGTNTLTGVIGEWLDSVPVLYISGQVKHETTIDSCKELGLRQLGDQEINIVDIVKPVTKFAAMVRSPKDIKKMMDKAIYIATSGRPGPVWLDIPLNVQGALVDENQLRGYKSNSKKESKDLSLKVKKTIELIKKAKRPVFVSGYGIKIAKAEEEFLKFIEKTGIPVLTTFNGFDIMESDNKYFVGRIGTLGQRAGNFALQNSDLIVSVGSRNNIRQVSYNWENFGRDSKKIVVDIDEAELNKPTLKPDVKVRADAGLFLKELNRKIKTEKLPSFTDWLNWCTERKKKYTTIPSEYKKVKKRVQPYYFVDRLTSQMKFSDIAVAGNGSACVALFQSGIVKNGQKYIWNSGCASMGYDLPAAIGACIGSGMKNTICLAGDGSLQMNMQELQTMKHYNLPIKIFYLDNDGYISIKQTQDSFFKGNRVACDKDCGVSFPDITKVAEAYGIKSYKIDKHDKMDEKIKQILAEKGPVVCDVALVRDYIFSPKLSSKKLPDGRMISKPLEDMYPFLERKEFEENMIIKPMKED